MDDARREVSVPVAFLDPYRDIFRYQSFRVFWLGFTFSVLGDAMTGVALTWLVYQSTHSARAVGLLLLASTGPVLVGGLLVGPLLDRFDRRAVMIADSIVRGLAVATIPLLYALGHLPLWPVYAVAAVYGCLKMITLAGGPALVPALVPAARLDTANALETLGYTVGGVIGPPLAGVLIARIGAPNVVLVDALSYGAFALALTRVHLGVAHDAPAMTTRAYRMGDGIALLRRSPVLFTTTLMFMTFNLGEGALSVWLPIFSAHVARGGAAVYGALLGVLAVGETAGSLMAGGLMAPRRLSTGALICLAQGLSGLALLPLLLGRTLPLAVVSLALLGVCSAPLTIWAQSLRMRIIPPDLRGRTFALLRTMMQGTVPLAGVAAGLLLPIVGIPAMIGLSALLIGLPGPLGYQVRDLRRLATGDDGAMEPGAQGVPVESAPVGEGK